MNRPCAIQYRVEDLSYYEDTFRYLVWINLLRIDGKLTGECYCNILIKYIVPSGRRLIGQNLVLHHNDSKILVSSDGKLLKDFGGRNMWNYGIGLIIQDVRKIARMLQECKTDVVPKSTFKYHKNGQAYV